MSSSIDERIVQLKFDGDEFNEGVRDSMTLLERFKNALNFGNAASSMAEIQRAADHLDFSYAEEGVGQVGIAFSNLDIVAMTVITRITNSVIDMGKSLINLFAIQPVRTGFEEYELKMKNVQSILANTMKYGTTLPEVNEALEDLNHYADKTIYNFKQMTDAMSIFTSAGIDLDTSKESIKGIANLAAFVGAPAEDASRAMYMLSQALNTGYVQLYQFRSLERSHGMGGETFQKALIQTAQVLKRTGKIAVDVDAALAKHNGVFRESLREKWLTTEVLTETLKQYAGAFTEASLAEQGFSAQQIEEIKKMAEVAEENATKVKTFTQLIDTLKEAAQSGWAESWQYIIGDLNEARELWTGVNKVVSGILDNSANARNEILKTWHDLGGRTEVITGIANIWKAFESVVTPIKTAFDNIFPKITGERLYVISKNFRKFTEQLKLSKPIMDDIQNATEIVFSIIKKPIEYLKNVAEGVLHSTLDILERFRPLLDNMFPNGLTGFIEKAIERFNGIKDAIVDPWAKITPDTSELAADATLLERFTFAYDKLASEGIVSSDTIKNLWKTLDSQLNIAGRIKPANILSKEEISALENSPDGLTKAEQKIVDASKIYWGTLGKQIQTIKTFEPIRLFKPLDVEQFEKIDTIVGNIGKVIRNIDYFIQNVYGYVKQIIGAFSESLHSLFPDFSIDINLIDIVLDKIVEITDIAAKFKLPTFKFDENTYGIINKFVNDAVLTFTNFKRLFELVGGDIYDGVISVFNIITNNFPKLTEDQTSGFLEMIEGLLLIPNNLAVSLMNIINAFKDAAKNSGFLDELRLFFEAIKDIFPSFKDFKFPSFKDFLKVKPGAWDIYQIFKGLFSILSAGLNIIRNVYEAFKPLVSDIFEAISDKMPGIKEFLKPKGFINTLADFSHNISVASNKLRNSDKLRSILDSFVSGIRTAFTILHTIATPFINLLKDLIATVKETGALDLSSISSAIVSFGKSLIDMALSFFNADTSKFDKFIESMKTVGEKLGPIFNGILNLIKGVWHLFSSLSPLIGFVLGVIGDILTATSTYFDNLLSKFDLAGSAGALTRLVNSSVLVGLGTALVRLFSSFSGVGEAISENGVVGLLNPLKTFIDVITKSVSGLIKPLKELLNAEKMKANAEALKNFAIVVGVLAAALILLSGLDPGSLTVALGVLASGIVVMTGTMEHLGKSLDKISPAKIVSLGLAFIGIGTGLLFLSIAARLLGGIGYEKVGNGVGGVVVLLLALVAVAKVLDKNAKGLKIVSKGIINIAVGMLVLSMAIKKLSSLTWDELAVGLVGVIVTLTTLTAVMATLSKIDRKSAKSLKAVSSVLSSFGISIFLISRSLVALKGIPFEQLSDGLAAIGLILLGIFAAMMLFSKVKNIDKIGASIGAAMVLMSVSMIIMAAALKKMIDITTGLPLDVLTDAGVSLIIGLTAMVAALRIAGSLKASSLLAASVGLLLVSTGLIAMAAAMRMLQTDNLTKALTGIGGIFAGLVTLSICLIGLSDPKVLFGAAALTVASIALIGFSTAVAILSSIGLERVILGIGAIVVSLTAFTMLAPFLGAAAAGILAFSGSIVALFGSFIIGSIGLTALAGAIGLLSMSMSVMASMGSAILGPIAAIAAAILLVSVISPAMIPAAASLLGLAGSIIALSAAVSIGAIIIGAGLGVMMALIPMICKGLTNAFKTDEPVDSMHSLNEKMEGEMLGYWQIASPSKVTSRIGGFLIKGLLHGLTSGLPDIGKFFGGLASSVTGFFSNIFGGGKQEGDGFLSSLANMFGGTDTVGLESMSNLASGLTAGSGDVNHALTGIFDNMQSNTSSFMPNMSQAGFDFSTVFGEGLSSGTGNVSIAAANLGANSNDALAPYADMMGNVGGDGALNFADLMAQYTPNAEMAADGMGAYSVDALSAYTGQYGNEGASSGDNFASGLRSTSGRVSIASSTMDRKGVYAAQTILPQWYQVGSDSTIGFRNGLLSKASAVGEAAAYVASQALFSAKAAVESNSPSKKFMQLGEDSDTGLIIGLLNLSSDVRDAGEVIGKSALIGLEGIADRAQSAVGEALEIAPTITPILDLTDVSRKASRINSMLPNSYAFDAFARVENRAAFDRFTDVAIAATDQNGGTNNVIASLKEDIMSLGDRIERMQVVMDGNKLVGSISKRMDKSLGQQAAFKSRGI